MKKKSALICVICGFFVGCETTGNGPQIKGDFAANVRNFVTAVEPSFRPAAAGVCALAISLGATAQDRADMRADIYTASSIVAAWDGQSPPALRDSLFAALPKTSEYRTVAETISGLAAVANPFIKGDPALLIKVTADLAAGCADATKPSL